MGVNRADLVAGALGAAAAAGTARALRRLPARRQTLVLAAALPGMAGIYPAARSGWDERAPAVREAAGVAIFGAVGALASTRGGSAGRRLAAGGWAAHALFDLTHERGNRSRIPSWYPAMCAGFDVSVAALMAR